MIRVASYNIRKCIGLDRRRDPERTLNVLREIDADIVALQEADRRFGARQSAIPPLLLRDYTDYRAVALDTRPDSIGWHGNAILVREAVKVRANGIIPLPTVEPRGAVWADVVVRGVALRVVGMHLDLSGLRRRQQVHTIVAHAQAGCEHPLVLMGDLNEWSTRAGCLRAFGEGLTVLAPGRSFHTRRPVAQLDRIVICDRLHANATGVHRSPMAARASDHLPVWASLTPTNAA